MAKKKIKCAKGKKKYKWEKGFRVESQGERKY